MLRLAQTIEKGGCLFYRIQCVAKRVIKSACMLRLFFSLIFYERDTTKIYLFFFIFIFLFKKKKLVNIFYRSIIET